MAEDSGPSSSASSSPSLMAAPVPLSSSNKIADRLSELDSSQSELLNKIQGLKQVVALLSFRRCRAGDQRWIRKLTIISRSYQILKRHLVVS